MKGGMTEMCEEYKGMEMEIVEFQKRSIITTSGGAGDNEGEHDNF